MDPCRRCAQTLDAEAVACPRCHALVYEAELDRLKQEALSLEANGQFHASLDVWRRMLPYLPPNTQQAAWIVKRIHELAEVPDRDDPAAPSQAPAWVKRVGPLAPIALMLLKGKGLLALFQLKSLLSLGLFAGFYSGTFGWAFGLGFAALILVHEMGHYIDITRRGLPADMPVFLPGLGAYVRWRALGVPDETRAAVSLAGPLAGALAAGDVRGDLCDHRIRDLGFARARRRLAQCAESRARLGARRRTSRLGDRPGWPRAHCGLGPGSLGAGW
jgi:hypothetical protein